MSKKRVFVFGLDGASWKIIDSLIDKGYLPFFKELSENGIRKNLWGTIPPLTAPSWSSFMTGKTPGEHGIYHFVNYHDPFDKKSQPELVNNNKLKQPEFWADWKKNKKIGLINLPGTYPVKDINGVMVSSLLTPPNKKWYTPESLGKDLKEVGYELKDYEYLERMTKSDISHRKFSKKLRQMEKSKFKLAKRLISREKWDFFFMLFSETDWCQHWFWRSSATRRLYQQLDRHLEQLYDILKEKYGARHFHFMLVSDHGFHPCPKIIFHIYPWLRQNGFIKGGMKSLVGRSLRKASIFQKDKTQSKYNDWAQTNVLRVGNFGMWLNKDRLGDKYEQYRADLIKQLKEIKYDNGWKVFKLVKPKEKVYYGDHTDKAPDIVWLTRYYFIVGNCSIENKLFVDRHGKIKAIHESDRKGIFLGKGWGLKGKLKPWENKKLHIWDLAQIFNQTIE
jgi:predicted AlkP superfamily phosphohydrolase/phosphomutase